MKRVCVIGCPGSGKSTFARALCEITGLPICHLDLLHHNPDRTTVDRNTFMERLNEVLPQERWIIDGNYNATMELRLAACDTVFFFDLPTEVCLAGVESRRGKARPDMPWVEMEEDPEFTEYIKHFSSTRRPEIMALLGKYADKTVTVFRSRQEADEYLLRLRKDTSLLTAWREEEFSAHVHGWDFSHINGRYEEAPLPWDYREVILRYLRPEMKLLDVDTGGGEFLLLLSHPFENTAATERYAPNVELCRQTLIPRGVDFREADGNKALPFADTSFDLIINRHGDYNPAEIHRVLKENGLFITQQVGAENDRELVKLLLGDLPLPYPEQYLPLAEEKFRHAGFSVLDGRECFVPIRFFDVGALVWFARIIEWEFPGFSVDACADRLLRIQETIHENGYLEGQVHRFLLVVKK